MEFKTESELTIVGGTVAIFIGLFLGLFYNEIAFQIALSSFGIVVIVMRVNLMIVTALIERLRRMEEALDNAP